MKGLFTLGAKASFCLLLLLSFYACEKDSVNSDSSELETGPDLEFYALTDDNKLLKLNANNPMAIISTVTINGLLSGEKALSIDFRPSTGQLYLLSSTSVLYTIDYQTGNARIVSTTPFDPLKNGTYATIDFNPTVDRIRLISDAGQNLRLHPETGVAAAVDGDINGVSGAIIAGAAYTNSKAGATETTLFDIDATTDKLYKQMPPNDGTLVEVGALGIDVSGTGGFDISAENNTAIAALSVAAENKLYGVDLSSGAAADYGELPAKIIGLAIPTMPVAYAVDMSNNLLIMHLENLEAVESRPITGLADDEAVVGIDMRPATAQLYALGNKGNLYTLNMSSGVAAKVGTGSLMLTGNSFGFDFNPTVDRIRIVSDMGANLRVNPNDGVLAMADVNLNPGMPMVTGAAYTNSFSGATETTLFDIDFDADKVYKQMPPNDGTLVEVGDLNVDATANGGFDIGGTTGNAYALLGTGDSYAIYAIDLATGSATKLSDIIGEPRAFAVGLGF